MTITAVAFRALEIFDERKYEIVIVYMRKGKKILLSLVWRKTIQEQGHTAIWNYTIKE